MRPTHTRCITSTRAAWSASTRWACDGRWTLLRDKPDFSPLNFTQRFHGTFSADGNTIDGRWDTSGDGGETWELNFNVVYTCLT